MLWAVDENGERYPVVNFIGREAIIVKNSHLVPARECTFLWEPDSPPQHSSKGKRR